MSRTRAAGTVLCTLLGSLLLLSSSAALAKKKKAAQPQGDFQPEAEPTGDQPSKVLERALKLYDGEDYYSASIELNKVVEGESGRQRGQQAEGRVLDGQGALQPEVLLGVAVLLRPHRAEGRRRTPTTTRP